jgi:site-specific recombinase XerD
MYGTGMRLIECCRLRVKDVDFGRRQLTVRGGKGDKDRAVPFPDALRQPMRDAIDGRERLHARDRREGPRGAVRVRLAIRLRVAEHVARSARIGDSPAPRS